ncbi:tight adherence pilus pseudopilin TadF [Photobacterium chitinilyticum]|nr:tight adherence pilus pseudopilin TadF [Photobacterium chitinilyticum]
MPNNSIASFGRLRIRQRGSSVIELPVIALVLVTLVVFAVKVGHGLSLKAKLDQLAYSLTSIVASERLEVDLTGSGGVITPQIADALRVVAERHFQIRTKQSSVGVGIHLEQLKFGTAGAAPFYQSEFSGAQCQSRQKLLKLASLAPVGTVQGATKGLRSDLFQVSVCLTSLSLLTGEFYSVFTQDFVERYYNSSAVLIGRQYD